MKSNDIFALTGIGDCYRGKEDHDRAVDAWNKIIGIAPNNKYILGRLGDVHRKKKQWQEAIAYYERVIAVDDRDLYALTGLYCCYVFGSPNAANAKIVEQHIARIDPTKKILFMKLGDAYKHERRLEEARECYQKVIAADPSNEAAMIKLQELDSQ